MEPKLTLLLMAGGTEEGTTSARLSVLMTDRDGKTCEAVLPVRLPLPPSFSHPWEWAQTLLVASADACDCLCDAEMYHDDRCEEARRADA